MADEMPLSEAATILGVTQRQAQRLAAGGELGHVRYVGRTVVVPSAAVHRAKNNGTTSRGRPAFPATAWMALALLSGRPADGPSEMRIADRMATMTPIEVARFTRRRATITSLRLTVRMTPDAMAAHLRNSGVKPTGLMSPLAVEWGLAGDGASLIDGYLHVGPDRTLRDLKLREHPGGRITLRLLDLPVDPLPEATVALDLMESMDSRARGVGRDRLAKMIGRLR
jgi:excisionase family DNA binding protein